MTLEVEFTQLIIDYIMAKKSTKPDVCPEEICDGSGEIATDVLDTDSMQYMRGVGTEKCLCQIEK